MHRTLRDCIPLRTGRQQRFFKSDSGLGSEFEIGRRNSRGNVCARSFHEGSEGRARAVHVSRIDSFMNGDHTWFERCPDTQYTASARQLGE